MLIRSLTWPAVLVTAGLILLLSPAELSGHPCDRDPGHKHCNGNGGGGGNGTNEDMAVSVTFRCPADTPPCDQNIWDDGGPYVNGQQRVIAKVSRHGHFIFSMGAKKNRPAIRQFVYDYQNAPGPTAGAVPMDFGSVASTGPGGGIPFDYETKIQVNRRLVVSDPRLMPVGDAIATDMWFDVSIADGGGGTEILGRFDSTSGNNCPLPAGSAGDVTLKRTQGPPDQSQWTVTASDGLNGCVTTPFESNFYMENFDMGGFEMVVDEL